MAVNQLERTLTDGEIRQLPLFGLKLGRDASTVINIGDTGDLPSSAPGFAPGAIFIDVEAGALYINEGSTTVSDFQPITPHSDIPRSALVTELKPYTIPATDYRVHDALHTNLPGTAASDDLALITGTFGTSVPYIQTSNVASGTATQRGAFLFTLPVEYVSGEPVQVRLGAGMLGAAADTSATIDIEVYNVSGFPETPPANLGSDLCTTNAQNINSLNFANATFAINSTALVPGATLLVRVTITATDAASGGSITGNINSTIVDCSVKG